MKVKALFPDAPEDLAALGDEALTDLLASFQDVSRRLRAGEIDLVEAFGEDATDAERSAEAMTQWRAAAEVVQEIRAVLTANAEAREAFDAEAAEIDAAFGTDEEPEDEAAPAEDAAAEDAEVLASAEDGEDGDEDEAAAEPEAEAAADDVEDLAAAADPPKPQRRVLYPSVPRRARETESTATEPQRATLIASAGQTDVQQGTRLDALSYAQAQVDMARRRGPVQKFKGGGRERILLASADLGFPEGRTLVSGDHEGNKRKIEAIGSAFLGEKPLETLLADGGICVPPTPFYDVPDIVTAARPVRDSFPGFQADRGGVSVPGVSGIGDIDDAITVVEAEDDAQGGTFSTKSCQDMTCAEWEDVFVGAIVHCRGFGNLTARTWPEGVAHENRLTMAAWARTAEGRLLDRWDALAGALVTRSAVYGALSTFIYALSLSRVGIISRERMDPATRFNVILPFWAATMMSLDAVNSQQDDRFELPQDAIGALLSRYGFNTTWHLDEGIDPSADAEIFLSQAAGPAEQRDWPGTTVVARLAPANQFLYLDGGTLELGLVRDSELNHQNNYESFGESWENLARIGPASTAHRIEITVCPTGVAAPTDSSVFACSST